MKTIVIKGANRRLRVCRVPAAKSNRNSLSPVRYVSHSDLHEWILDGMDFAVHSAAGSDLTRSVLLDLLVHACEEDRLHIPQERLVQLIEAMYQPKGPNRTQEVSSSDPRKPLVVRFYALSRRYYSPGLGYLTLSDLSGFVARGRQILVVTQESTTPVKSARHVKGFRDGDVDITHHTLTVMVRMLARTSSAAVLGVPELIELLKQAKIERPQSTPGNWDVQREGKRGNATPARKARAKRRHLAKSASA